LQYVGNESPGKYRVLSITKDGIERSFFGPITSVRECATKVPWHIIVPMTEATGRDSEKIPFFVTIET
jgi:hypothetical protein